MARKVLISALVTIMIFMMAACSATTVSPSGNTASPSAGVSSAVSGTSEKTPSAAATVKMPAPFKIGFPFTAQRSSTTTVMLDDVKLLVETAGGELIVENWDATPEGTISAVEALIAAGVKGIILIPLSDSILPKIAQMCEEANVYWSLVFRTIVDETIKATVEKSKYYVGNCHEDEEMAGYSVTKMLAEQGAKNMAFISLPKGDTTTGLRELGMNRAAQETGMKILAEARNISQGSDVVKAVQSFIASYPELDSLFVVGATIGDAVPSALQAIGQSGKGGKILVGMIGLSSAMTDDTKPVKVNAACGGHTVVDPVFSAAMTVNAVLGTRLSDKPTSCTINYIYLKNTQEAVQYFTYVEGTIPVYSAEEIKQNFIKYFNPDITEKSFVALAQQYSLKDVVARRSK